MTEEVGDGARIGEEAMEQRIMERLLRRMTEAGPGTVRLEEPVATGE